MAVLFLTQFLSAAAHFAPPRETALREVLWSYHVDLGITRFLLVALRGIWGLLSLRNRPTASGPLGRAPSAGHAVL